MAETVIKYRKTRTPRTFKIWETAYHYEAMQAAIEVKAILDNQEALDNVTAIDSEMLWHLTDAYIQAYERLMKEGLIISGNIHKIQPTLN